MLNVPPRTDTVQRQRVFVGRTKFIEKLLLEMGEQQRGQEGEEEEGFPTRIVVMHGESGCGKTWLLDEYYRLKQQQQQDEQQQQQQQQQQQDEQLPSSQTRSMTTSVTVTVTLHSCFSSSSRYSPSPHDDPLAPLWQALSTGIEEQLPNHHIEDMILDFIPLVRSFLPQLHQRLLTSPSCCQHRDQLRHHDATNDINVTWTLDRIKLSFLRLVRRLLLVMQQNASQANDNNIKVSSLLIWCLDDLHSASPEALHLIQRMLFDVEGIRLVCTCRRGPLLCKNDDGTSSNTSTPTPTTHIARWLAHVKKALKSPSSELKMRPIPNLTLKNITHLVEMEHGLKSGRPLAKLIEKFTAGHALAVSQLLLLLQELRYLNNNTHNDEKARTTMLEKIAKLPLEASTCLERTIRLRFRALPPLVQSLLIVSAAYPSHVFSAEALYGLVLCQRRQQQQRNDENGNRDDNNTQHQESRLCLPFVSSTTHVQKLLLCAARVDFLSYNMEDGLFSFCHSQVRERVLQQLADENNSHNSLNLLHYELGLLFQGLVNNSCSSSNTSDNKNNDNSSSSYLSLSHAVTHWNHLILGDKSRNNVSTTTTTTTNSTTNVEILNDNQRKDLAVWNHRAAMQAKERQLYLVASKYLETATLLLSMSGEDTNSDTADSICELEWTCNRIQAEMSCGHWGTAAMLAMQVRKQPHERKYTNIAWDAQIFLYQHQRQRQEPQKAIDACLYRLKYLGEGFPATPENNCTMLSSYLDGLMSETKIRLVNFRFLDWYRPSLMDQSNHMPAVKDVLRVLEDLAQVSVISSPQHYMCALLRAFQLSLQHGRFDITPLCFMAFAHILLRSFNKWNEAKQFAEAGLQLAGEGLHAEFDTRAKVLYSQIATFWGVSSRPEDLNRHVETLVSTSALEFATLAKVAWFWASFPTTKLDVLAQDAKEFLQLLSDARRHLLSGLLAPCLDMVEMLLGLPEEETTAKKMRAKSKNDNNNNVESQPYHQNLRTMYMCGMITAFLRNDIVETSIMLDKLNCCETAAVSAEGDALTCPTQVFLQGWVVWALAQNTSNESNMKQTVNLYKQGESITKQFEKWAAAQSSIERVGPNTMKPLLLILRSQDAASRPRSVDVKSIVKLYDTGIAAMRRAGYGDGLIALSYEQAGLFLKRQGVPTADRYLRRAMGAYEAWGALAKVEELKKNF